MSEFRRAPAAGRIRKGVVGVRRALVRQGRRLDSPIVCALVCGTSVLCTDLATERRQKKRRNLEFVTRMRIVSPLIGWCSAHTLRFDDDSVVVRFAPEMTRFATLDGESVQSERDDCKKSTEDELILSNRRSNSNEAVSGSPKALCDREIADNEGRMSLKIKVPHLEVISLNDENFEASTRATEGDSGDWLVFIVAQWCSYCTQLDPIIQTLRVDLAALRCSLRISTLDATESPCVARRFGVRALPTIIFLHWGSVYEFKGPRTSKALVDFVSGGYEDTLGFAVPRPPELPEPPSEVDLREESRYASIIPLNARVMNARDCEKGSIENALNDTRIKGGDENSKDVVASRELTNAVTKMQALARGIMSRNR